MTLPDAAASLQEIEQIKGVAREIGVSLKVLLAALSFEADAPPENEEFARLVTNAAYEDARKVLSKHKQYSMPKDEDPK